MATWFDRWLYKKTRDMWDNSHKYEADRDYKEARAIKMNMVGAQAVERGRAEGEDRISFELSTAVGGRILNVRRYDTRKDQHDSQTYVIPNGEDVGARVAKILNLELIK
jgi:hypothetical protein